MVEGGLQDARERVAHSPQVCLQSCPDRLAAAIGPRPSKTRIGITRNVATDQATPAIPAAIVPITPARSSIARRITETVALRIAQGSRRWILETADFSASPSEASSPRSRLSAANTRAALKKVVPPSSSRAAIGRAKDSPTSPQAIPEAIGSAANFRSARSTDHDALNSATEFDQRLARRLTAPSCLRCRRDVTGRRLPECAVPSPRAGST